jgi:FixJ family two-component response regulator
MPGMSGLQLQRRLAEGSKPIPIIFLSAHSSADEEFLALQAGALQFLQKPVSKEALLPAIRDAIKSPPSNARSETAMKPPKKKAD